MSKNLFTTVDSFDFLKRAIDTIEAGGVWERRKEKFGKGRRRGRESSFL